MRSPSQLRHGWPLVPRTAVDWLALPEVPLGRYLLADVGWVSSRRETAIAAGVGQLPAPRGESDDGFVALPAVTVVAKNGGMQMFRLPVSYAAIVRRFALNHDGIWHDREIGRDVGTKLPCHFVIGDDETVYLLPEDEETKGHLN